jgi:hypothetical protein
MGAVLDRSETRIAQLARAFPCLRNAPGIEPWDANRLDDWAGSGGSSHGEKCSARFVLAVWNPDHDWQSGKFDLMEALRVWDIHSHTSFLVWAADPWWA